MSEKDDQRLVSNSNESTNPTLSENNNRSNDTDAFSSELTSIELFNTVTKSEADAKIIEEIEQLIDELKLEFGPKVVQMLLKQEYLDEMISQNCNTASKNKLRWKIDYHVTELTSKHDPVILQYNKNRDDLKLFEKQMRTDYGAYSSNTISKQTRYNILDNGLSAEIKDEIVDSVEQSVLKLSTNEIIAILSNRASQTITNETIKQVKDAADNATTVRSVAEERQRELSQDIDWVHREMHDKSIASWTRPFDVVSKDEAAIARSFARSVEIDEIEARKLIDEARIREIAAQEAYAAVQLRAAQTTNSKLRAEMIARQEEAIAAAFDQANHARAAFANYYNAKDRQKSLLVMYCTAAVAERKARRRYARAVLAAALDDAKINRKHAYEDWKSRVACDTLVVLETRALKMNSKLNTTVFQRKKNQWNHFRAKSILNSDKIAFKRAWPEGSGEEPAEVLKKNSSRLSNTVSRISISLYRFAGIGEKGEGEEDDDEEDSGSDVSDEGDWV